MGLATDVSLIRIVRRATGQAPTAYRQTHWGNGNRKRVKQQFRFRPLVMEAAKRRVNRSPKQSMILPFIILPASLAFRASLESVCAPFLPHFCGSSIRFRGRKADLSVIFKGFAHWLIFSACLRALRLPASCPGSPTSMRPTVASGAARTALAFAPAGDSRPCAKTHRRSPALKAP